MLVYSREIMEYSILSAQCLPEETGRLLSQCAACAYNVNCCVKPSLRCLNVMLGIVSCCK